MEELEWYTVIKGLFYNAKEFRLLMAYSTGWHYSFKQSLWPWCKKYIGEGKPRDRELKIKDSSKAELGQFQMVFKKRVIRDTK